MFCACWEVCGILKFCIGFIFIESLSWEITGGQVLTTSGKLPSNFDFPDPRLCTTVFESRILFLSLRKRFLHRRKFPTTVCFRCGQPDHWGNVCLARNANVNFVVKRDILRPSANLWNPRMLPIYILCNGDASFLSHGKAPSCLIRKHERPTVQLRLGRHLVNIVVHTCSEISVITLNWNSGLQDDEYIGRIYIKLQQHSTRQRTWLLLNWFSVAGLLQRNTC